MMRENNDERKERDALLQLDGAVDDQADDAGEEPR
jgi:hypothetical protein